MRRSARPTVSGVSPMRMDAPSGPAAGNKRLRRSQLSSARSPCVVSGRSWARAPGRSDGGMGCSATAARSTPAMRRRFAGGGALEVGTVIWATALRTDHARIDVPVPDNRGRPIHQRGVTGWPGLCFVRLTRQHTRARRSWAG